MILKNKLYRSPGGQSILEYSLLIAVVVAALMAMNTYIQRSMQANLKTIEDQVNAQPEGE